MGSFRPNSVHERNISRCIVRAIAWVENTEVGTAGSPSLVCRFVVVVPRAGKGDQRFSLLLLRCRTNRDVLLSRCDGGARRMNSSPELLVHLSVRAILPLKLLEFLPSVFVEDELHLAIVSSAIGDGLPSVQHQKFPHTTVQRRAPDEQLLVSRHQESHLLPLCFTVRVRKFGVRLLRDKGEPTDPVDFVVDETKQVVHTSTALSLGPPLFPLHRSAPFPVQLVSQLHILVGHELQPRAILPSRSIAESSVVPPQQRQRHLHRGHVRVLERPASNNR
mmetsp:Transcript_40624/g.106747  ORF Transcript_40624/g.106747 Transcript_40624/m.106747 type:complete len:277 (+) Transcript_40624:513-1343(+)